MNGPPLRVRLAEPTDADGIAEVHVQSWRETYSGLIPDRFMDAEALEMRRRMWASILALDPPPGTIVVAEGHGFITDHATLDDPDLEGVVEVRMVR